MLRTSAFEDTIADKIPIAEQNLIKALNEHVPLNSPRAILEAFPNITTSSYWFDAYVKAVEAKLSEFPELNYVKQILRLAYLSRYPSEIDTVFTRLVSMPETPKELDLQIQQYIDILTMGKTSVTQAKFLNDAATSYSGNRFIQELFTNAKKYAGPQGLDLYVDWLNRQPRASKILKERFGEAADAVQILDYLYAGEFFKAVTFLLNNPEAGHDVNSAVGEVFIDYARPFGIV